MVMKKNQHKIDVLNETFRTKKMAVYIKLVLLINSNLEHTCVILHISIN